MELRGSLEMPSDAFVLGMMRFLLGGINKLSPIFLTFDVLPNMQPQYLFDTIMKTGVEFRSNQNFRQPKKFPHRKLAPTVLSMVVAKVARVAKVAKVVARVMAR